MVKWCNSTVRRCISEWRLLASQNRSNASLLHDTVTHWSQSVVVRVFSAWREQYVVCKRHHTLVVRCARQLQQLELSRGLRTWCHRHSESIASHGVIEVVAARWSNAERRRCLINWKHKTEKNRQITHLLCTKLKQCGYSVMMRGFAAWLLKYVSEVRNLLLVRNHLQVLQQH